MTNDAQLGKLSLSNNTFIINLLNIGYKMFLKILYTW